MRTTQGQQVRERFEQALGGRFEVSRREARWLGLGDELVAFAADDEAEWRRLEVEGWLLERWRRARVPAPRVVHEDVTRRIQARERLHGLSGLEVHSESTSSPLYPGDVPDARQRLEDAPLSPFGANLAASYGELAARIRGAVSMSEASAAGLGPTSRRSIDIDDAIAKLRASNASNPAKAAASRARDWLVAIPQADSVIHADLHFFNLCVAADGTITGVFDVSDAGIDAAAQELSMLHSLGSRFVRIALDAYGPMELADVRRAHLRNALDHVLSHGPGTPRHASIIAWASAAFEKLL
jgi:hypothetical protein